MKKVVAVYGNPGCGKSGVSLALAANLAAKKKEVIVISGDKVTPMLKVYAPTEDIPQNLSIGGLLMDSDISEKAVSNRIVIHRKSKYLGFMGMASYENVATYNQHFNMERINAMLGFLYRYCDYLIIDCSSNLLNDDITLKGLEIADVVVQLITPNIAGLEFWRSMSIILKDERFKHSLRVPAISCSKSISPVYEVQDAGKEILGEIKYVLPYSHEVEDYMMCGKLIKWLGRKEGIAFENTIEQIVKYKILKQPNATEEKENASRI